MGRQVDSSQLEQNYTVFQVRFVITDDYRVKIMIASN